MDVADEAGYIIDMLQQQREAEIRRQAAAIPVGAPGDCAECGGESPRLVHGICAPCRDLLKAIAERR